MSDEIPAKINELLESPRSRGHFLKGAAVAAAGLGLAPGVVAAAGLKSPSHGGGSGGMPGMSESASTILDIAATAEAAAVTALYHVHLAVLAGHLNVSGIKVPVSLLVSIVRAALREEQDHYAFITGAGGRPLYTSFSFPPAIFTNAVNALEFLEVAEGIFVGAYMAANREFANAGHGTLAQYAYQIGGVECEHRTLVRAGLGQMPPNNKSFETNLYSHVAGAAKELAGLGIFKPNLPYPGGAAVDKILGTTVTKQVSAGVVQRNP